MNAEITLLGFKGRLTRIAFKRKLEPWHPEDELLAIIEFDPLYPEGILSMGITLPVKDYSREELLKVIQERGEAQLATSMANQGQRDEEIKRERERRRELAALAQKIEAKFSG